MTAQVAARCGMHLAECRATGHEHRYHRLAIQGLACWAPMGAKARILRPGSKGMPMKARDIMSSPVISVRPERAVGEIARLLVERKISAVPVLEDEHLVGLVSEADVLRRRAPGGGARCARDIMTHEVETVAPDMPVERIAGLLEERGIKRVPVVQAGRVVGIVSRSNLVQALAVKALPEALHPEQDEAIRSELLSRLQDKPWWQRGESNVVVDAGVVHFWGRAQSDEERAAARAAAEGLAGVRRVEDHRLHAHRQAALDLGPRIRRASERGHSKHGWVDSCHSFSFGDFYDPGYMGYGPLRAINEKRVQADKGSTTYGLRGIEIITYVLDGAVEYEDSLDHNAVLSPGGVQCLSAGSGVRISELNGSPSQASHFLQIWLDSATPELPAACAHKHFAPQSMRGTLRAIVSHDARDGSLRMRQDVVLYAGLFDGDERARLEMASPRLAYVHVARGAITAQGRQLAAGDGLASINEAIVLERGRNAEVLVFDLPEGAAGYR
jgi:redox-sensitive bicupin YhaK (pirin superfamily)/predicted transcriptional regulator